MFLTLVFHPKNWNDLVIGIQKFVLVHHTAAFQKSLQYRSDQHQVMEDGEGESSLPYYATLVAPYGVPMPVIYAISRGSHIRLQVLLAALIGLDHTDTKV